MLDSLIEDHGVIGRNEEEIRELLGPSIGEDGETWRYRLAPVGAQYRYLYLSFEKGIVVTYNVGVFY
jgi:hypothetical protein